MEPQSNFTAADNGQRSHSGHDRDDNDGPSSSNPLFSPLPPPYSSTLIATSTTTIKHKDNIHKQAFNMADHDNNNNNNNAASADSASYLITIPIPCTPGMHFFRHNAPGAEDFRDSVYFIIAIFFFGSIFISILACIAYGLGAFVLLLLHLWDKLRHFLTPGNNGNNAPMTFPAPLPRAMLG